MFRKNLKLSPGDGSGSPVVPPPDSPMAEALGASVKPTVQQTEPPPATVPAAEPKPATTPDVFKFEYQKIWDQFEKDGIEIPSEYKTGKFGDQMDEVKAIRKLIIDNTEFPGENDPFIQKYLLTPADKRQELLNSFVQDQGYFNLDANAGLKKMYQEEVDETGKRTFEDADIDEYLNKLNKIEKEMMWRNAKTQKKQMESSKMQSFQDNRAKEYTDKIVAANKARVESANTMLEAVKEMKEFGGVPLDQDTKDEFSKMFTAWSQLNPKTGRPYFIDFINEDDSNFRDVILAYSLLRNEKVKAHLSSYKEDFKEELLNGLDLNSKPKRGGHVFSVAQSIDDMV